MRRLLCSLTPQLLCLLAAYLLFSATSCAADAQDLLLRGFAAEPDPTVTSFQPLLTDPTNNFSLSFLRVGKTQLALAVVHIASGEPLWQADMPRLPRWSSPTQLSFNGSLIVSDSHSGVFWSTKTDGDRVLLSNSSNLQIIKGDDGGVLSPIWQSFDFPSDTLVENQIFTSAMALVSSNGLYTMRLGSDFIGFYARFNPDKDQMYYKHRALQAKADVVEGQGPIYIRISSDGYLGMYQNGLIPVDIQSFNSYQRSVPGIRRMRIGPDGNLKGYYWSGSEWVSDYVAISETCDLPSACGPYGLCRPDDGSCSCLETNRAGECSRALQSGDFCKAQNSKFRVLRKAGVELPYKELMGYVKTASLEKCEMACATNCSCWGAVYSNGSGFCYNLDYPIQTLVEVGDGSKVGYFKVREGTGRGMDARVRLIVFGILLSGASLVLVVGVIYCCWSSKRKRRSRGSGGSRFLDEEKIATPGPYKDLRSSSFGSVELSTCR